MGRAAPVLLLALLLAAQQHSSAQMDSPLKGRGLPQLETTEIFTSVYLDRLMNVDEDNYRWEAVHYFYLAWTDLQAYELVLNQSVTMLTNSSYQCEFYCSNVVQKVLCCDNMYLPSFSFKNAYGFPQDREVLYNIYPANDGSILWEVRVHGIYYQPMDFSHYPFDSFDLSLVLRFFDPTIFVNTTLLYGEKHPGVKMVSSSGGKKLYTVGLGDDTSSWAVTDFSMESYTVDMGDWFQDYSDLNSAPADPMPLAPINATQTDRYLDEMGEPVNAFTGVPDQLVAVYTTIERFWKPSLINAVLPVVLVFSLGLMAFFCSESALDTRLEIVVTLFLALTAVQFVVVDQIPTSSYVVPTQQLVLATYIYLFLLATESIVVYHIVCRYEKRLEAKKRREAWQRYCKLKKQGKLKGGKNPTLASAASGFESEHGIGGDPLGCSDGEKVRKAPETGSKQRRLLACGTCFGSGRQQHEVDIENGEPMATMTAPRIEQRKQPFSIFFHAPKKQGLPLERTVTTLKQMTADEAFGQYVGHLVDNVSAAVLGIGYSITTILIFVLQKGYIDLFSRAEQAGLVNVGNHDCP